VAIDGGGSPVICAVDAVAAIKGDRMIVDASSSGSDMRGGSVLKRSDELKKRCLICGLMAKPGDSVIQ
jgi:hypothetical protein